MLATPPPEPFNLRRGQGRVPPLVVPSSPLPLPPLPVLLVQGNPGKPVAPMDLLGPSGRECSTDVRACVGLMFIGQHRGGQPRAEGFGGPVPGLPAPDSSLLPSLKSCLILAEASMSPLGIGPKLGQARPKIPRSTIPRRVPRPSGLEPNSLLYSRAPSIPLPLGCKEAFCAGEGRTASGPLWPVPRVGFAFGRGRG